MSRCMHVFLWPGRSFVLGCPSAPVRPPFPPPRARIYPLAVLASHGVREKLPLPGISLPILQPDTTPHTPRCNSPLIRAPPHPDVDANLEFKADPEPHSLIYLSIPIPILCYLYLFIIFLSPFANHHHHCSCKTHRPVSHPTSVFTTPRTHTKYKQVKSLYPHYLLAPSDPHFHILLDRKTSTPDPCAPLLFDFDLEDNSQSFGHFTLFRHLLLSFLRCTLVFNGLHFGLSSSNTSSSPSPCPRARTHPPQIHHLSRLTSSPAHRARPPFAFNSIVLRYTFVPLFSNLSSFFVLSISISVSLCFSRPVSCVPVPLAAVVPLMHS